jgi:hypothetical protein
MRRDRSDGPLFDLVAGRRGRDEGTERAENAVPEWREIARKWISGRATQPGEFNADDLRRAVGPPPGHYNAMGAVFLWAMRVGLIESVGLRQRGAANAHAQLIRVYRGSRMLGVGSGDQPASPQVARS